MSTVSTYEAKTQLPRLIRAAERGETVIITRHGKPVAQLGPVQDRRREDVAVVIERIRRARALRAKVAIEGILASRHERPQILRARSLEFFIATEVVG